MSPRRPITLVDGTRVTELSEAAGAPCVSWSPDRQRLAHLTGTIAAFPESLPGHPVFTIEGTLWLVARTAPAATRSPTPLRPPPAWRLVVWRDLQPLQSVERASVAAGYRTFDWAAGSDRLCSSTATRLRRRAAAQPCA
jgi:hypothetical protein